MSTKITLQHDGTFDIALGRHRWDKSWKNREMTWQDFVIRISKTARTAETYKDYMLAKKARQDEIKDVGGYVGGYVAKGRRLKGNVTHRQLITLDIDFGPGEAWDDFTMMYGCAAAIYSTHKHSPHKPRYRLIIPLDRPVFDDQYQAIARKIADHLDIENFDHTTFQASRLMYWPSTSKDGEYHFEYQDGPWLSADDILNSYTDWTDSSEWPMCSREDEKVQYGIKQQGDPLEKGGIIGAYCRTYTIQEVIETQLSDVYEPCDTDDRFTYTGGSTAGGLVVYEDKFAFSHHGTDPTSGKLCNAFDLVRLHKFASKDDGAAEGTPSNRLPSYLAMQDYCTKDVAVRKQLGTERLESARHDFDVPVPETDIDADENNDWISELDIDKKGNFRSTIDNVVKILKNDPAIKGKLRFNAFEQREIATANLPWRKVTSETMYLTDKDDAGVRHYMERVYEIGGIQKTTDAMSLHLAANSFHPVRDYLNGLKWDGRRRLDTLLIDYLGAEDSDYVRMVTRKTFVGAVARIFRPGVKFDTMLTLLGPQGAGKSTLIKKMGREWFSDTFTTVQGKESFEQLQGCWIVEVGELAGLNKAETNAIKSYVSKTDDRYRVAYGRRVENFPRQCIFIGTSNNNDPLRDATGGRRFWVVAVSLTTPEKSVFEDLVEYEVGQLWAEAVEAFKLGETIYLDQDIEKTAKEKQAEHTERDERTGIILKYLDTLLPENWKEKDTWQRREWLGSQEISEPGLEVRTRVCVAEIYCELLGGMQKDMDPFKTKSLHNIMRSLPGWTESGKTDFPIYGTQRAYRRTEWSDDAENEATAKADFREEFR